MRRTLVVPSLLLAACASAPAHAPKPTPSGPGRAVAPAATNAASTAPATSARPKETAAADLSDHLGDSTETAVSVPKDAPNDGLDWMNNWTFDRYGRFRIQKRAIAHAGEGAAERRYRITTIEVPDGSTHTIYFDITENWNAWRPSTPVTPPPH
jgi:hypothetical protein